MSLLVVLVLALAVAAVPLEGKWELRKNEYVVEMDMRRSSTVELVCDAGGTVTSVKWQKGSSLVGHGRKSSVTIKEIFDGGNYTCHDSDGRLLGYNFLYINELFNLAGQTGGLLKQQHGKFIDCEAKNYNGTFSCSWAPKVDVEHHFMFQAQYGTHSETIPIKCTNPETANKGLTYSVTCNHSGLCPYGEEHTRVKISLNVTQENKFSSYPDIISIGNILKPDPPEKLQMNKSVLSWDYPSSWSSCTTFFPLLFNVSYTETKKPKKKASDHLSTTSQRWLLVNGTSVRMNHVKQFCIQAKDPYHPSHWSREHCSTK